MEYTLTTMRRSIFRLVGVRQVVTISQGYCHQKISGAIRPKIIILLTPVVSINVTGVLHHGQLLLHDICAEISYNLSFEDCTAVCS